MHTTWETGYTYSLEYFVNIFSSEYLSVNLFGTTILLLDPAFPRLLKY
jgi:hypothetical protein